MLRIRLYIFLFCLLSLLTQTDLQSSSSSLPTTSASNATAAIPSTTTTTTTITSINSSIPVPSTNGPNATTTTTTMMSQNSSVAFNSSITVGTLVTSLSASNSSAVPTTAPPSSSTNQMSLSSSPAPMTNSSAFQPTSVSTQTTIQTAVLTPSAVLSSTAVSTSTAVISSTTPTSASETTPVSGTGPATGNEVVAVAITMSLIIIVLILLLGLILVFGLWYTRRKSAVPWYMALIGRSPSQQEEHTREKSRGIRRSVMLGSQMMSIDGGGQQDQLPFMNETLRRRLQPISVADLPDQVRRMHQLSNQGFRMEYESLEMAPQATFQTALLEENRHKNRYRNILPYDHSRVRLQQLAGKESSDYINADYIDAFREPNKFIAAQGPLLETLEDFWRMAWEVRSQNLVMLTNLKEYDILGNERNKCERYWPEEVGSELKLGLMNVKLTKVTQLSDYVIREMTVSTVS